MNERIKSLLVQAHLEIKEEFGIIDTNQVAERFATLIIDECIQIAMNAKSMEAAALIVMHFGDKNAIE